MNAMKGHVYSAKRFARPAYIMPKLNGLHMIWKNNKLMSLDGKIWNENVLPHIYEALRRLEKKVGEKLSLTGEAYVHGWSLQRINSAAAVKRKEPSKESHLVKFYVFDFPLDAVFYDRATIYTNLIKQAHSSALVAVPFYSIDQISVGDRFYHQFIKMGYEGAMYHIQDESYQFGRSWNLLKRKEWLDAEFKIVGVEIGEGKHSKRLGAIVCKTRKGLTFNVGTGISDIDREKFWKKPPIGKMLTVKYLTLSDDGIPLNLSSLGIREQK